MMAQPTAGAEVRHDAGAKKSETDQESTSNPTELQAITCEKAVQNAQDKDEDGGFREEGSAAVCGDADQIEEGGGGVGCC